jgi:hypothetical protein
MEPPPRDIDEPPLWTMTADTARFLNDKRSQAGYDEYLHIGHKAFESCTNASIREGLHALSAGPPLSIKHIASVAITTHLTKLYN